ncbi:MAG: DUF1573 domain-containing protein [Bacteroidales bacterium]|jgi:hypothetical protein|nr:DUF1573 domain-containing protein [Bacteroidales bacterium]
MFRKILFLFLGIFFVIGSVIVFVLAIQNTNNNVIKQYLASEEEYIEIGDVGQGIVKGETYIKNYAGIPITINRVMTNCRCSEVVVSPEPIQPNERRLVRVNWDTTGLRGQCQSEFFLLYSIENENQSKSLPLSIQGNIIPHYDIEPSSIDFKANTPDKQMVKLIAKDKNNPIKITKAYTSFSAFIVTEQNDREVIVSFDVSQWKEGLKLPLRLVIETDCVSEPSYEVPLKVFK